MVDYLRKKGRGDRSTAAPTRLTYVLPLGEGNTEMNIFLRSRSTLLLCGLALVVTIEGCQAPRGGSARGPHRDGRHERILGVRCLYDQKPWLNLDKAGDRDPEGIRYRVFLDPGTGRGVLADGTFHVEMYKIGRSPDGAMERTLVSDWHYPTSAFHTIAKPGMLGEGYFLHLRWATKDIAGNEIEIITQYEDATGRTARSATKRLRVPKYTT